MDEEDYTDEFPEFVDYPDDSDWDAPGDPHDSIAEEWRDDAECEPYEHDDMYDVESALGSAGYGTDEWYE
jgi:hypothetical protein|tara:strand:+ start:396 stop:605 length:210 start_codon:yes stop_codon:yes gene_type:complete